ncbi:MAG TPA: methyltransferase domain-containing protein [Pyrinomonadaceae bacterium]|nr:methyltransferase domain-containing protein [Pyrinomonadaceae bacterium]
MAALSDNSTGKNSKGLLPHTGEGVVIDIGTGDGRFVSAAAGKDPNKFFIGIDANAKPLEKPSMKATRKPGKGGLPNAMFVQAAVEDLPEELNGIADEIHIHFPWGSLLRAVASGDEKILASLHRISAPGCLLEIVIGIDPGRDKTEIERLGVPELTPVFLHSYLIPKYKAARFDLLDCETLTNTEWSQLETSWARRLQGNDNRNVWYLVFTAA